MVISRVVPVADFRDEEDDNNDDDNDNIDKIIPMTKPDMGSSTRKGRGKNKNTAIVRMPAGQKITLEFHEVDSKPHYDNRTFWSRHIGTIIRDSNVIRHRTLHWGDLSSIQLDHM